MPMSPLYSGSLVCPFLFFPLLSLSLLQIDIATVEKSLDFSQKTKDGTAFQSSDPTAGIIL